MSRRFVRTARGLAGGLLTLLAAAGCGDQGPTGAGELTVSFYQSGSDAGAILLTVSGGLVLDVTAVGGQQASFGAAGPNTTRIVVAGALATGQLLRIRVPDVAQVAACSVRVNQVAHRSTFALLDPARFSLSISR